VDSQGNFVVVWESNGSLGTDTENSSIQAQRYAATGAALGSQFQVNNYTTGSQASPRVSRAPEGGFVVVWKSLQGDYSIEARRYAANGAPLGGQFRVNTYTSFYQLYPAVAVDAQGNFVVAWECDGSPGSDSSYYSIQARRYSANGTPLGVQFQVNSYTTGRQDRPAVAAGGNGTFIVAWSSIASEQSFWSIQAQRYAANGVPLGGEFRVNSYTASHQLDPVVAAEGAGNFVLTWEGLGASGSDTDDGSIQARHYGANGIPMGTQIQVNTYTTGWQGRPHVAADGRGNFVFAWDSDGSNGTDADLLSVQSRRYDSLFRDGFETGGAGRWSISAP
jgi:hypothetical protein